MNKRVYPTVLLLFLVFLISSSHLSARFIATKQEQEEVELNQITKRSEEIEPVTLMNMEACDTGDEECLKRRTILEAHLDYVYTQHHKP
ncbi:hypothetical protein SLEP1_g7466 [Rubroshorea leprosula]|uniref:Phytosulfokine n=1 Tax=Rubroshorea leprosula TaxID=152421 RepID=A0AAV5I7J1_9ROSI|nr:hypothetical protein SLEP1_g7466 [Rubroshorea leprosula]